MLADLAMTHTCIQAGFASQAYPLPLPFSLPALHSVNKELLPGLAVGLLPCSPFDSSSPFSIHNLTVCANAEQLHMHSCCLLFESSDWLPLFSYIDIEVHALQHAASITVAKSTQHTTQLHWQSRWISTCWIKGIAAWDLLQHTCCTLNLICNDNNNHKACIAIWLRYMRCMSTLSRRDCPPS